MLLFRRTHFRVFHNPHVYWHFLMTFTHLPVNLLSRRTFCTSVFFLAGGECQLDEGDWHCCQLHLEHRAGLDESVSGTVHVLWLLSHPCGCHTCVPNSRVKHYWLLFFSLTCRATATSVTWEWILSNCPVIKLWAPAVVLDFVIGWFDCNCYTFD